MKTKAVIPESITNPAVHDTIAHRAYELWEREGSGHGSHERHWLEAERQLNGAIAPETVLPSVIGSVDGQPEPPGGGLSFPPREAGHPASRSD